MASAATYSDRAAERQRMVRAQIAERGVRDEAVLGALRTVPRELFVPDTIAGRAYEDCALPVECAQTISQPYMVARMTELLELTPESRVLEIGTGSGYQAAVLAMIAREVYTIEWHAELSTLAQRRLAHLNLRSVTFRIGDGSAGWPANAPYDAILVTAGAPGIPADLVRQLTPRGRLVLPSGPPEAQTLLRIRNSPHGPREERLFQCRFVPLRGIGGWDAPGSRS